jgi:PAS domain S-box-containing protein
LKRALYSLLIVLYSCLTVGQNTSVAIDQLNSSELTGTDISALFTDHKGYLWVGTANGLNRYDGYNFISFRSYKKDSNSLSYPAVQTINEFADKQLLIGTTEGLNLYSFDNNNFKRISIDSSLSNLKKKNSIRCLAQQKDGKTIVGTSDGILQYDPSRKKLVGYNNTKTSLFSGYVIQSMCIDEMGNIWAGTKKILEDGGLLFRVLKYNVKEKTTEELVLTEYGSTGHVGISCDKNNLIWVAIDNGVMSIDPKTMIKTPYYAPSGWFSNVSYFHSKDGFIYQGYWSFGVTVFNVKEKTFELIKNDPDNSRSLMNNKVWALHKDHNGVLWFGTEVGLQKQSNKRVKIDIINRNTTNNLISSNQLLSVWSSRKYKSKILFGIDGDGFSIYDEATKKIESHGFGNRNNKKVEERFLTAFTEIEDGTIYAAGQYNFLKIDLSGAEANIKHIFYQQQHHFTCLFRDNNDKDILWLGSIGKVAKFNTKTQQTEFIITPANAPDVIYSGISHQRGTIFTSRNCIVIINGNNAVKRVSIPDAGVITSIEAFDENYVVLGTSFLGLIRFNLNTNDYDIILNKKNKYFAEVRCIKKVKNSYWIGTTDGLYQYYPLSNDVVQYGVTDGLPSNIIQYVDFNGLLYLATNNGLAITNPKTLSFYFTIPQIDITSITGIGNDLEIISDLRDKTVEIPLDQNSFRINFTALDFNMPDKNSFKYKFTPGDGQWKNINYEHSVSFNGLDEGVYEFEIIGSNSENVWNTIPVKVKIKIVPPFYRSRLFYILCAVFGFLLLIILIFLRSQAIKKNRDFLEKTIETRTEELKQKQKELQKINNELQKNYKKTELAYKTLAISEGNFKQITETIDDVFYLYNIVEKKYEYISPNCFSVLGLEQQYFYDGKSSKVVVHKDDLALVIEANVKIDAGIKYDIEYRVIVDGKIKWIAEKSSPIFDDKGLLVRNSGICRDITARKSAEDKIIRINNEITEGIAYAEKIQKAFLVGEKILAKILPNSFIYFRPKEKVSGDFYWISKEGSRLIIAVGDCTGHGVPGAMLSFIGTSLLNKIVHEDRIFTPGEILTKLNFQFYHQLNVDEKSVRDGMDITIVSIDIENKKMSFAGARNNGSMIIDGMLSELKAQRETVGENEHVTFLTKEVVYDPSATYYLYSDGFKDQFGGPNMKKLASKQFKEIISKGSTIDMNEQNYYFSKIIQDWQGTTSQTDDRLVIGFRVP